MIDFSQYQEHPIFKVGIPNYEDPGSRIADFREAFFELRRVHYINYIEDRTNRLNELLGHIISSGTGPGDTNILSASSLQKDLRTLSPSIIFRVEQPKASSANCLGTDYAYDMFRRFLGIASQLEGLSRYDETFVIVIDDIFSVLNQIFNKIGTRGQLFGYIDQEIIILCDYIDGFILDIENSTTWADAITIVNNSTLQNNLVAFRGNVIQAANDMRLLVEPVVKYLNIMGQSNSALSNSWGSYALSPNLQNVVKRFNTEVIDYNEDYYIKDAGAISQIFEQIRTFIKPDNSNFELMVMKSSRMGFDEINVTQALNDVQQELIIPNYNP